MNQTEFDSLFDDVVNKIHNEQYTKEKIYEKLSEFANESNTLNIESMASFCITESQNYTQALLREVLSRALTSTDTR